MVRFQREDRPADESYSIACNRWETQLENARDRVVRQAEVDRRELGVTTADSKFATARLSSDDEDTTSPDVLAVELEPERNPHEILGVAEDAPDVVSVGRSANWSKELTPARAATIRTT